MSKRTKVIIGVSTGAAVAAGTAILLRQRYSRFSRQRESAIERNLRLLEQTRGSAEGLADKTTS
jgi:gas vesicle protein